MLQTIDISNASVINSVRGNMAEATATAKGLMPANRVPFATTSVYTKISGIGWSDNGVAEVYAYMGTGHNVRASIVLSPLSTEIRCFGSKTLTFKRSGNILFIKSSVNDVRIVIDLISSRGGLSVSTSSATEYDAADTEVIPVYY